MKIPFFSEQFDILFYIALWRNEWFDPIFRFLNYFDSIYFILVLIPFIWVGISYRWGLRLACLSLINFALIFHLKHLFNMPRPAVDFPELPMYSFQDPSFPSGAAQMSMLLGGLLIHAVRRPWAWVVASIYILLIGFSRLYLGVHYPTDILGGWLFGFALLFAYIKTQKYTEGFLIREGPTFSIVLCCLTAFLYGFSFPSPTAYQEAGAFLGFGIGAYISIQYRLYSLHPNIFRGIVAILSTYLFLALLPTYTILGMRAFLVALWISLGAAPFCRAVLPKKL